MVAGRNFVPAHRTRAEPAASRGSLRKTAPGSDAPSPTPIRYSGLPRYRHRPVCNVLGGTVMLIIWPYGRSETGYVDELRRVIRLRAKYAQGENDGERRQEGEAVLEVGKFAETRPELVVAQWISVIDKIARKPGRGRKPTPEQRSLRDGLGRAAFGLPCKEGSFREHGWVDRNGLRRRGPSSRFRRWNRLRALDRAGCVRHLTRQHHRGHRQTPRHGSNETCLSASRTVKAFRQLVNYQRLRASRSLNLCQPVGHDSSPPRLAPAACVPKTTDEPFGFSANPRRFGEEKINLIRSPPPHTPHFLVS